MLKNPCYLFLVVDLVKQDLSNKSFFCLAYATIDVDSFSVPVFNVKKLEISLKKISSVHC